MRAEWTVRVLKAIWYKRSAVDVPGPDIDASAAGNDRQGGEEEGAAGAGAGAGWGGDGGAAKRKGNAGGGPASTLGRCGDSEDFEGAGSGGGGRVGGAEAAVSGGGSLGRGPLVIAQMQLLRDRYDPRREQFQAWRSSEFLSTMGAKLSHVLTPSLPPPYLPITRLVKKKKKRTHRLRRPTA